MSRTNSAAVVLILGNNYDSTNVPSLTPFIDTATAIVNRVAACAILKGKTLTSEELELIERWLSAHFYTMMDPTFKSRSTASASGSWRGSDGMKLDASLYGQQAKMLDYSGCLESFEKRQVIRVEWLGKPPSTQTDYEERN